jgi:VIT1/CCC1 family predicted Fe2+/Mn2+ transporter
MLEELGLVTIDPKMAAKCGIVTLISFVILGAMPAMPYVVSSGIMKSKNQQMMAVLIIGVLELFSLGFAKAALIQLNPWKSGVETLLLGAIITAIGYGVGILFA